MLRLALAFFLFAVPTLARATDAGWALLRDGGHVVLLRHAFVTGWTGALNDILVIAGIVALVGAALALVLVRERDFVPHGAPAGAAPQEA